MLVFVDESGDTGLKFGRGSSERFVVVAVCFDENSMAASCDKAIGCLRRTLRISPEFKFAKTEPKKRIAFFQAMNEFDFYYYGLVLNKRKLYGKGFGFRQPFYKTAVRYTVTLIGEHLVDAKVVLDKTGEKSFIKSMQGYLKKHTRRNDGTSRISKVGAEDSKKNNLLQLADMVCGAVARSFDDRKKVDQYRLGMVTKERYVQLWPK